jgi:hypothetical protein
LPALLFGAQRRQRDGTPLVQKRVAYSLSAFSRGRSI